ncbi:MAG: hypothetical protein LBC75_11345 [Fibromonadaceae bacterium]|jgi:hypothetical protein|nr:hypothetical protein [Fibromonadaceae bacterium]
MEMNNPKIANAENAKETSQTQGWSISSVLSSLDEPITGREVRTICKILQDTDNDMYISESEFCLLKGISESKFYDLRKRGFLDRAFYPASRGLRYGKRLINKFFNLDSGLIEIPDDYIKPNPLPSIQNSIKASGKKAVKIPRRIIENLVRSTYESAHTQVPTKIDFQRMAEIFKKPYIPLTSWGKVLFLPARTAQQQKTKRI